MADDNPSNDKRADAQPDDTPADDGSRRTSSPTTRPRTTTSRLDDFPGCSYVEVTDRSGHDGETFRLPPIADITALAWADDTLWVIGSEPSDDRATIYRLDVTAVG